MSWGLWQVGCTLHGVNPQVSRGGVRGSLESLLFDYLGKQANVFHSLRGVGEEAQAQEAQAQALGEAGEPSSSFWIETQQRERAGGMQVGGPLSPHR